MIVRERRVKSPEEKSYENSFAIGGVGIGETVHKFSEGLYEGGLEGIGVYLSTVRKAERWVGKTFSDVIP